MAGRYEAVLTAAEKLHVRLLRLLTGALTCTLWTMPVLGSLGIWDLMTHGPGLSAYRITMAYRNSRPTRTATEMQDSVLRERHKRLQGGYRKIQARSQNRIRQPELQDQMQTV